MKVLAGSSVFSSKWKDDMNLKYTIILGFIGGAAHGAMVGNSTFPMKFKKNLLTTQFNAIVSDNGGAGFEGRYTKIVGPKIAVDGGVGISGGTRMSAKLFAGFDYELLPDYDHQPRFSLKTTYENEKQYDDRINSFSVAPTLTKGFNFWGKEGFPFAALPIGVDFNAAKKTYETTLNLNFGVAGQIPLQGMKDLIGNIETSFNLKDSYSTIALGVSFPLD